MTRRQRRKAAALARSRICPTCRGQSADLGGCCCAALGEHAPCSACENGCADCENTGQRAR